MFPLVRSVLHTTAHGVQRIVLRGAHRKYEPDFHDKYDNAILIGGTITYITVFAYVGTQVGLDWNSSPVCRVTPKEWRED
uniref:Cytochrome c oxidase subunit 7B, mitochondrial n=1 Tax=Sphenodon punctatus TaxID=8508 RepID=A0A8D0GDE3_SPHPU